MIEKSPSLVMLLRQLQKVPYLASKNLYLVAQYFLDLDQNGIDQFCNTIKNVKNSIEKCQICWTWKEKTASCYFCSSPKRDKSIICVVETWRDLIAVEKTGCYQGVYHVLCGVICPLDGVGPSDLTIKHLFDRVKSEVEPEGKSKELILALNQTPEGEATSAYIASKLKDSEIKISCLARGLPVGSNLESMDRITVSKALSERRLF